MKHIILIAAALIVSACGFTPLHAPSPLGVMPTQNMYLDFVETDARGATGDKIEFLLRQSLIDSMGTPSGSSPYTLSLTSKIQRSSIGVRQDDVAGRFDLRLTVNYRLLETKTGDVLDTGSVSAISTFGAPGDPYGSIAAQNNAEKRVAREAADRLLFDVATYFKRQ
ncbi:LPS assembly lipoprotein LptE [Robiginitomaculum antarcticum]|uniref:LPS assembly lipoprotein LptE n=1 Tax=Robiginitomaculum antarcticum TaxID=437507 RepID=UPI00036A0EC1|nr:LPS assembly lipoprotein LptE [Robiginitomaculum antarcticum]